MTELAIKRAITDAVAEYDQKLKNIENEITAFQEAGTRLNMACKIQGTYGNETIDTGKVHHLTLQRSLLKSAWRFVYDRLQIDRVATASDKKKFEQELEKADIPFTIDNIRATFGDYRLNPRQNILRGLAEVFSQLDSAYKSHEKVKIGVKGLPKRIILSNVSSYSWGMDRLKDVLNALAAYQGKPLVCHKEIYDLLENEYALKETRDVTLKRFSNGNGHLFFGKDSLRDINMALAEYYGDVLPDCPEENSKKAESTSVSKDLQYYPTPKEAVEKLLLEAGNLSGKDVLEPSCGCGRIMDAARGAGANVFGIEYDYNRVAECKRKGHKVLMANFLETVPVQSYDVVLMNPPFYGKHYAKHVEHAMKFLKPDGRLFAILPATARYDHGLLDGIWRDLPTGAFRESGTNIATTILEKSN